MGQGDVEGGPQTFTINKSIVKGGVGGRQAQSDNVGQTHCFDATNLDGGSKKQQRGVYSDGPKNVFIKLNKGPITSCASPRSVLSPINPTNSRIHPVPANIRKQQKLINNLHLRIPASSSSKSETNPLPLKTGVNSLSTHSAASGVLRIPPSRKKQPLKPTNSLSSAGEILCCSSINSSDIRNCNKRFVDNFNHVAAQKVWKGAVDLGVVGVEGEDTYVKRILINENNEEEARIQREQHCKVNP
jgi:hypothetical protein